MELLRRAGGARSAVRLASIVVASLGLLACPAEDGAPGRYSARGIVEDVDVETRQVLVDHEDVPGLMPAMTMNFVVPDDAVLEGLARGQVIEFELEFTGRSYEIASAEVVGEAPFEAGWRRLGDALVRTRPAPAFELIDQAGRPVRLADFDDRILLVDFVFTECPGPCPIQTSRQVSVQERVPEALRETVHFVSISLDPETDRPEVLERYARERGADLSNWSFLTGETETVEAVVRDFGVGSVRQPDGGIDHTLITFLVRDGRILEHYTMQVGQDEAMLADVAALADPATRPEPGS